MTVRYIYEIINKLNNKTYRGQRTVDCEKFTDVYNDTYLGSGVDIRKDIKLYGTINFEKKILTFAESQEELDLLEMAYIQCGKNIGKCEYNKTFGGQKIKTKKIFIHSNTTNFVDRNKIRKNVADIIKKLNTVIAINNFITTHKYCYKQDVINYLQDLKFVNKSLSTINNYMNYTSYDFDKDLNKLNELYNTNKKLLNKNYEIIIQNLNSISSDNINIKFFDHRNESNKLSENRKNQFKFLWTLFDKGLKNREIFREYSNMFSKSIINRERTQYNKEHKLIKN